MYKSLYSIRQWFSNFLRPRHTLLPFQFLRRACSGGYSNLGARGKNFQKLMLSEKKKRSDLGLHIFLPKSGCSRKKKKVFTQNRSLNKHLQRIQNCMCYFRGGPLKSRGPSKKGGLRRLPHSPHPISTTARLD